VEINDVKNYRAYTVRCELSFVRLVCSDLCLAYIFVLCSFFYHISTINAIKIVDTLYLYHLIGVEECVNSRPILKVIDI